MFIDDAEVDKRKVESGSRGVQTQRRSVDYGSPLGKFKGNLKEVVPLSCAPRLGMPEFDPELCKRWKKSMEDERLFGQLKRLLKRTLIFSQTNDEFRSWIVKRSSPKEYAAGQDLWKHGDAGNWLGIVLRGCLRKSYQRSGLEIPAGELGPGGCIGDVGVFSISSERPYTVTATEKSVVLVTSCAAFEDAVNAGGSGFTVGSFDDGTSMNNLMQDFDAFKGLRCFQGLDTGFVKAIHENSEPRLGYPGEILLKEHHFGNEMFILRAGSVKIIKDNVCVVELPSGVVFGELAVLGNDHRRTATVECSSLSLMRVVHSDVFFGILEKFPTAKRVFDHSYIARMVALAVGTAKEEISHFNRFFGAATPKSGEELQSLVGGPIKVETQPRRKKSLTGTGKLSLALPPVTPRKKKVNSRTLSDSGSGSGSGAAVGARDHARTCDAPMFFESEGRGPGERFVTM